MFDVVNQDDLRKWARFILSCGVAAFVSFWGAFGTIGYGALAAGLSPWVAMVSGFFGAMLATAGAVLATAKASPLWPDLVVILPKPPPASPTEQPPLNPPGVPANEADRPTYLTG